VKYSDVIVSSKTYKPLRETLKKWILLHRRYFNEMYWDGKAHDVSYWYGERTHLGLFASAVWSAGGVALEEYGDEKKHWDKRRGPKQGRVDLYLSVGKLECIAEAKMHGLQCHQSYSPKDLAESLTDWCYDAKWDVKRDPHQGRRLGLVFVAPWFKKPIRGPLNTRKHIELAVEAAKRVRPEFLAWHFDRDPFRDGKRYWPGVIVIGDALRR
jgi:hypothetical protein